MGNMRKKSIALLLANVFAVSMTVGTDLNVAEASTNITSYEATIKAEAIQPIAKVNKKVLAYIRPNFTVEMEGKPYIFYDVNGNRVYPLICGGSTYLPLRAMSSMMGENIEWENANKSIYIGKNLDNPSKAVVKEKPKYAVAVEKNLYPNYADVNEKTELVEVTIRSDIRVLYDFEDSIFLDEGGIRIYPIIYKGSSYLPARAIAKLMDRSIEWNHITKTVSIGEKQKKPEEIESEKKKAELEAKRKEEAEKLAKIKAEQEAKLKAEKEKLDAEQREKEKQAELEKLLKQRTDASPKLKLGYGSVAELQEQSTEILVKLQKTKEDAVKGMLAEAISGNVRLSEKQRQNLQAMKKEDMALKEKEAYEALVEYAEISGYYILLMENISYMSVNNQDFSMLSETFVNFAIEAQSKGQRAKTLVDEL